VRDMNGCVQYWNKSCQRLTGWTAAEALGKPMIELLKLDPAEVDRALQALFQQGHWIGEILVTTRDQRRVPLLSRCTLVRDERGQPKSVLAINTDMTERKEADARFLRAQRLENIGQLAGGIAHDLNNILAPILMCAPMLREEINSPQGLSMLNTLEASARRGAEIVQQVLTFARGTEGRRVLLQPYQATREIAKFVQATFPKSITLETAVPGNLWPISADPTQLHQVLLNLALNARDAMMPQGGTLKLAAENVLLRELEVSVMPGLQPGPHVLLRVSDTGPGIPPEVADRVFHPFFTTKGEGKGTGLGLSTVLGLVKDHGGFVDFTSRPGQGTEFRVFLPAQMRPESASVDPARKPPPGGHGELILIADDEEAVRSITRRTLESFGYRTLLANNGAEAVALFQEKGLEIALVLLDLNMPVLSGADTLTALFKLNPKVRVVVATGMDSDSDLPAQSEPAVRAILQKPFDLALLLNTLNQVITMD
jgi:PAS domain S-box-containing protein